jgi:hypothetical protein
MYPVCYTTGSSSTAVTWVSWNVNYQTTSAITTGNVSCNVWVVWNGIYPASVTDGINYAPVADTEEMRVERERRAAEAEAKRLERFQAVERAKALLIDNLDNEQRAQFTKDRHFIVHSRDRQRRYRVEQGFAGNVKLLRQDGKAIASFCIHPDDRRIPAEDVMLSQKLLLETAEEEFLRIANRREIAA